MARHGITLTLWLATLVSCLSTLQFGYHLAVLNAPASILTCHESSPGPLPYEDTWWSAWHRRQCIPVPESQDGLLNTMYTVGGLLASTLVGCHFFNHSFGRRLVQQFLAVLFVGGLLALALANSLVVLCFGRLVTGVAAGACMVVAPILVSEISPHNHRGALGLLLQFATAMGILTAQLAAFPWNNDLQWRNLLAFGAVIGVVHFALLFVSVESPKWLVVHTGNVSKARESLEALRTVQAAVSPELNRYQEISQEYGLPRGSLSSARNEPNEESALLEDQLSRPASPEAPTLSITDYILGSRYRKEWIAVTVMMTAQQLSGMNAITFYGVSVVSHVVPKHTNPLLLTLALALTNVVAALAISPFIDRWGRKLFLLLLATIMGLCAVAIGAGLTLANNILAVVGCFGFIVGFSLGLNQIPFLMVNELSSQESVGLGQSLGTMTNWLANIALAYFFPVLQAKMGGLVFFLFFGTGVVFCALIYVFVPETKGKTEYDEVWGTSE